METAPLICPKCGAILAPDMQFCPHCGMPVAVKPLTIGMGKQIYIYVVSLLLPPLGLIWTWKYLRSSSSQAKKVGWIALILTIISVVATIWLTMSFLQGLGSQINSVSNYNPYGL